MENLKSSHIEKLVRDYYKYASKLLQYTDIYWDNMYADIQGYLNALAEDSKDINVDALKKQISTIKLLINAHKSLEYIYG